MNLRISALTVALVPMALSAQIELVKDFGSFGTDPFPRFLKASGSLVYFTAFDPSTGWEMWRSDGSIAGTFMLKDINPGAAHGTPSDPWAVDLNGTLFFAANDGAHGVELWKSDGSAAGTVMVKDINTNGDSYPSFPIAQGGYVLFAATDGVQQSLWRSAGDASNTATVFNDFSPVGSLPVLMQDVAYYNAYNTDAGGYSLFKASASLDFAEAVYPPANGGPGGCSALIAGDTLVYFTASSGDEGTEPWVTDGYEWATLSLNVRPGPDQSYPANYLTHGDVLYMRANDGVHGPGLYRFTPGYAPQFLSSVFPLNNPNQAPRFMAWMNENLYYFGYEPTTGTELYRYDVNADTTVLVMDVNPGPLDGVISVSDLFVYNDRLYFIGHTVASGNEVWTSDGTAAGTFIVQDRNVGPSNFDPMEFTLVGSILYMRGTVNGEPDQLFKLDLSTITSVEASPAHASGPHCWPNPAREQLHIEGVRAGDRVVLLASDGRALVPEIAVQQEALLGIDVTGLPAGVVIVQVTSRDGARQCIRAVVE